MIFKDKLNRQWDLTINVGVVRRVRKEVDVDLGTLFDTESLNALVKDVCKFSDAIFAIVRPQAESFGVSQEDFDGMFDGDLGGAIEAAFYRALVNFFPPEKRPAAGRLLDKLKLVQAKVLEKATAQIDQIDPDTEANEILAESLKRRSENVPASSA